MGESEQLPLEKRRARRTQRRSLKPMKKLLRQDALYLAVVDLPTHMEQDAVRPAMEALADDDA